MKKRLSGASILILAAIACGPGSAQAQDGDPNQPEGQGEELLFLDPATGDPALMPAEGEVVDPAMVPAEGDLLFQDQAVTDPAVDPSIVDQPEVNILVDQNPVTDLPPVDAPMIDGQPVDPMADPALAQDLPTDVPVDQQLFDAPVVENAPVDGELAIEAAPPLDALPALDAPQMDQATDQPLFVEPSIDQALPDDQLLIDPGMDQATDQPLLDMPVDQALPEDMLLPDPGMDQVTDQPLLDMPVDQALPEDMLLPEPGMDQATDQPLLDMPVDQALPEDLLLPLPPADGVAAVPQDQLLPEPGADPLAQPAAGTDTAMLPPAAAAPAVDVLGNPVDLTGQVLVVIENASAADLLVMVEPDGGGEPVPVVSLPSGYRAVQPSPVGRVWRLAQNDAWVGGFVPTAEPEQYMRFTGEEAR